MTLADMLAKDGIVPNLKTDDKKDALRQIAVKAAGATGVDEHAIFTALIQRERLSSTSLGRGIAIPHVKLPAVKAITCLFARLDHPIPFESHDGEPVDLLFFLLAPEHAGGDHLKALARISRLVRDPATLDSLRLAKDTDALYRILTAPVASHAA